MRKTGRNAALLSGLAVMALAVILVPASWRWVRLFREFEGLGRNAQGYPEYRHRETGIVFVPLPGGTSSMGNPEKPDGRNPDPMHSVSLSPFLIAKHEVSQAEWRRVMGGNPSRFKGDKRPVDNVSWEKCQEFCAKTGLLLPSEAQWEYACRAGTATPFAFGKSLTKEQARFFRPFPAPLFQGTVDVGSFEPNGFGLYNMHGNVYEWCQDVYDPEFYRKPEASRKNPVCTSGSESRVIRGGGWYDEPGGCRSAARNSCPSSAIGGDLGFRPVAPSR